MRKLAQFVARLYPKAWRERYGAEFDCLLDDLSLSWQDVLDVLQGGLKMRMTRSKVGLVTAAFGIFGAIACGLIGLALPKGFESTELMHVQEWSLSPVLAAGAAEKLSRVAFSPEDLEQIVERYDLYPEDRAKRPLNDVLKRMRDDIHIAPYSGTTFRVSFAYPDRRKAQQVTIRLMERLNEADFAQPFGPDGLKSAGVGNLALPNKLESAGLIDIRGTSPSADKAIKQLASLANDAFTPGTLKRLIEENDLYPERRAKRPLEDVIQQMRRDIRLEPRSGSAIQVSFVYPDRGKVQQVTSRLMRSLLEAQIDFLKRGGPRGQRPGWTLIGEPPTPPEVARSSARAILMGVGLGGGLLLGLRVSFAWGRLRQGRA